MFKTNYNAHEFTKSKFEPVSEKPSLSVPDQSLTITQVLNRFQAGTLPAISKNPQYDYDETTRKEADNLDVISPFRRQNYDLADYTVDSITNSNSVVSNKNRVRDLEKQITIQKALEDADKKAKESKTPIDNKVD